MSTTIRNLLTGCAGVLLAASCFTAVAAASSAFVNSRSEPHGVLYLDYKMVPRQIYPVRIWMVNGKLTNRSDQRVVWMKPGDYKLTIKLTKIVNMDYTPGLAQKMPNAKQMQLLKLNVDAGNAYYLGAQFDSSGAWQPVVWKTTVSK